MFLPSPSHFSVCTEYTVLTLTHTCNLGIISDSSNSHMQMVSKHRCFLLRIISKTHPCPSIHTWMPLVQPPTIYTPTIALSRRPDNYNSPGSLCKRHPLRSTTPISELATSLLSAPQTFTPVPPSAHQVQAFCLRQVTQPPSPTTHLASVPPEDSILPHICAHQRYPETQKKRFQISNF